MVSLYCLSRRRNIFSSTYLNYWHVLVSLTLNVDLLATGITPRCMPPWASWFPPAIKSRSSGVNHFAGSYLVILHSNTDKNRRQIFFSRALLLSQQCLVVLKCENYRIEVAWNFTPIGLKCAHSCSGLAQARPGSFPTRHFIGLGAAATSC